MKKIVLYSLKLICVFIYLVYCFDVIEGKFFLLYFFNDVCWCFVFWLNGGRFFIGRKGLKKKIENVIKK